MATSVEPQRRLPTPEQLRKLHARLATGITTADDARSYCSAFLADVVGTLGVSAGVVWLVHGQSLEPVCVGGLRVADLEDFAAAADEVVARGVGQLATAETHPGLALLLYPVRIGTTIHGVVGLADDAASPPPLRSALQRMLVPLCDHLAEYLQRCQTRAGAAPQKAADADGSLAQFIAELHAPLDLARTAAAVANETARMVGCDRVSTLIYARRRAEASAVSGQDYLDRRATLITRLEALAGSVAATGDDVSFPDDAGRLAPQVDAALQQYLEEAQARRLHILPLRETQPDGAAGDVFAVLVVEWIASHDEVAPTENEQADRRLAMLLPHITAALANSIRYEAVPLRFLTGGAAKPGAVVGGGRWSRRAIWMRVAGTVLAALVLVPWSFEVEARGTLQPVTRRDVFAPADGVVERIFIRHGDRVKSGDPLFELRSTDLDVAEADLIKQINETEQEIANAQRQYSDGRALTEVEQSRLVGQIAVLEQRRESLRRQASLFAEKRNLLRVASPMAGQISTWNVAELLAERPVKQGQTLTSLVDPAGEWEIEIRVPEDRFGHVVEAERDRQAPPEIVFVLAADPNREYRGKIVETHLAAEPRGEEGNIVLVRASIDKSELAQLHPGSDVRVRVECGTRSLGYVLLSDVWNFVQTRILFKIYAP
ncbi:MAG: biotin/lipoyl-binding protein [Pirellulales bacterium]